MAAVVSAPTLILNTTVVSNFLQAQCAHLLQQLPTNVALCPAVLREVLAGIESGKVRPAPLEWLRLINLEPDEIAQAEQLKRRLGEGEAESIAVAVSRGWAFATDDWTARRTALLIGVSITGTIGILAELTRQGVISLTEANAYLQTMVQRGYRSPVSLIEDALQE